MGRVRKVEATKSKVLRKLNKVEASNNIYTYKMIYAE